jgi:hypothetical protein
MAKKEANKELGHPVFEMKAKFIASAEVFSSLPSPSIREIAFAGTLHCHCFR